MVDYKPADAWNSFNPATFMVLIGVPLVWRFETSNGLAGLVLGDSSAISHIADA
jgi:hypothetical protein